MTSPCAVHVVDALIAARFVDPAARQDSIRVVAGAVLVTGVTLLVASFAGYRLRAQATD
jgi:hypothetical protein